MNYTKIDHIDSKQFVHEIPNIFEIVVKLAKEFNIQYVVTHYEEVYFVSSLKKNLNLLKNIPRFIILNNFAKTNQEYLNKSNIKTNNYILGLGYLADNQTIESGLKILDNENCTVEAIIDPCKHSVTQNKDLKDRITRLGFEITAYKDCK